MTPTETVTGTEETTQTTTEQKPEVKTFAQVEAEEKARYDKQHNRDIAKLFPGQVKVEVKTEAKPEAKVEEKATPAQEPPKQETKADRDIGKLRFRNKQLQLEIQNLNDRLSKMEGTKTEVKTEVIAPVEPKREEFKTVEEYIAALRKFDQEQRAATEKLNNEKATQAQAEQAWSQRISDFNSRITEFKKDHPDWDEKAAGAKVAFEPALVGVMVNSGVGPDLLYYFAEHQAEAKSLNKLTEQSVVAASGADDVGSVLKYLSANPGEVAKLNGLSPNKAVSYIGRIEAKIEAEEAQAKSATKPNTSSGAQTTTQATEMGGGATKVETRKQEPPPRLSGGSPASDDWRDPANMTFKERERLFLEDRSNRRR